MSIPAVFFGLGCANLFFAGVMAGTDHPLVCVFDLFTAFLTISCALRKAGELV